MSSSRAASAELLRQRLDRGLAAPRFWLDGPRDYSVERFAAKLIGARRDHLHVVQHALDAVTLPDIAVRLSGLWEGSAVPLGAGVDGGSAAARWGVLDLHDGRPPRRVPASACGPLDHEGRRLAVSISPANGFAPAHLSVYSRRADRRVADDWLARTVGAVTDSPGVLFGRMIRTSFDRGMQLIPIAPPAGRATDLHLPDGLWDRLHQQVLGTLRIAASLSSTAIGGHRGVLLHGAPGTGKTTLCGALAAAAVGSATVVEVAHLQSADDLSGLYEVLPTLAPALVLIEDVDALAPRRNGSVSRGLAEFLNALDGIGTDTSAIVTVMTTNDVRALDEAATRAGRVDVMVELPRPTRSARAAITRALLAPVEHTVDVDAVAGVSEGLTAADLREVIRDVVFSGEPLTTRTLVRRIDARSEEPAIGTYL